MSENIPQTSASERVEAAQRAIMWLSVQLDEARATVEEIEESRDAHDVQGMIDARDSADNLLQHLLAHGQKQLDAIRALITPPDARESEEAIAQRVSREATDFPDGVPSEDDVRRLIIRGIRAGIQSAHESWEPSDRPSQEMMLRWLGIGYLIRGDEIAIPRQSIEREEI